jgi:hypothetical protein
MSLNLGINAYFLVLLALSMFGRKIFCWEIELVTSDVVMNFILDDQYGNPVSQLKTVLKVIAKTPLSETESNPLALLDNLYTEILSAVPPNVLPTTMSILAWSFGKRFHFVDMSVITVFLTPLRICNWWGIGQADSLQKLHSVLYIPSAEVVERGDFEEFELLEPCHASFSDYLTSHLRSGDFYVTNISEQTLKSSLRVLLESYSPRKWFLSSSILDLLINS